MRIYITGIAGFLGSNLSHYLGGKGHDIFGTDNFVGGDDKNVYPNAVCWNYDVMDEYAMRNSLENAQPEVIIHTACYPHEGLSMFSPKRICESVAMGTIVPLNEAINLRSENKIPFHRFINMSSMARYGVATEKFTEKSRNYGQFKESDHPYPQDPYGAHKYAAELTVKSLCEGHGIDFVNLIPHNIYGPRQKYSDPYRNVISIMIHRALRGDPIVIYGDGEQKRCFTYVDDILPVIEQSMTGAQFIGQTVNIGPDSEDVTINTLARLVQHVHLIESGNMAEVVHTEPRIKEVKHASCSAYQMRSLFKGEFKETPLINGIHNLYNWIKESGVREWDYDAHELEIRSPLTPATWLGKL